MNAIATQFIEATNAPAFRALPRILEGGLIVALAWLAAQFVWIAAPPQDSGAAPALTQSQSQATPIAELLVLLADAPFGRSTEAAPVNESFANAPETTLNLSIAGIRLGEGDAFSTAYIARGNAGAETFQEGEEITPGVIVRRILVDRVILSRNGRDEVLRQERTSLIGTEIFETPVQGAPHERVLTGQTGSVEAPSQRPQRRGGSGLNPASTDAAPSASGRAGPTRTRADRSAPSSPPPSAAPAATPALTGRAGEKLSADLLDQIDWRPELDGANLRGIRISARGDDAMFLRAGLKNNDLVTAVNGVSDYQGLLSLLDDAEDLDQLDLVIERDGATRNVTVDLR